MGFAVRQELGHGCHAFHKADVDDGVEEVGMLVETDGADCVGEEVAFAVETGCGGDVGEVVEMDCCS